MGSIYVVMGKSASGKDSIYSRLLDDKILNLRRCVIYTTRPKRDGEQEGREYHFVSDKEYDIMLNQGKVIEHRTYDTAFGKWHYFTLDDGQFDSNQDCLLIGTIESFVKIRNYFDTGRVVPIYIEVDDYNRLLRAIDREHAQEKPGYVEMCRRFIADSEDFSEDNINKAGIEIRFVNDSIESCVDKIVQYIKK